MNTENEKKLFLLKAAECLEILSSRSTWEVEKKESIGPEKYELSISTNMVAGVSLSDLNEFNEKIKQFARVTCIFSSVYQNRCKIEIVVRFNQ